MAYSRKYHTVIPVEPGTDTSVLRWLTRESFDRTAAGDCLQIVEYTEAQISADEIPPKAAEQLGRPLTDFEWWSFSAVAMAVDSAKSV